MFTQEIDKMSREFLSTHPEGVFVAYRFRQPPHINVARKGSSLHVSKEKDTTLQPGDSFERKGTTFQMFRIYEAVSNLVGTNSIAVAYFDKDAAAADGKALQHFCQLSRSFEDSNFEVPSPLLLSWSLSPLPPSPSLSLRT